MTEVTMRVFRGCASSSSIDPLQRTVLAGRIKKGVRQRSMFWPQDWLTHRPADDLHKYRIAFQAPKGMLARLSSHASVREKPIGYAGWLCLAIRWGAPVARRRAAGNIGARLVF